MHLFGWDQKVTPFTNLYGCKSVFEKVKEKLEAINPKNVPELKKSMSNSLDYVKGTTVIDVGSHRLLLHIQYGYYDSQGQIMCCVSEVYTHKEYDKWKA